MIAQVVKRYARRRVVETERRMVDGTPARVETLRRRSQGDGVSKTADIERLHATFRACLASLTRRGRALARRTLTLQQGMYLIGTVYNFCTPHASLPHASGGTTPAMAAGITDHRRFPRSEMLQQSGRRLRSFCPEKSDDLRRQG